MEHERKHIIKIPENVLRQLKDADQAAPPAPPAPRVKRKRLKLYYRRRLLIRIALFILIPLAVIGFAVWALNYKNAVEVYASDQLMGTIRIDKRISPEYLMQEAQDKLRADNGTQVNIASAITLKPVHAGKSALMDTNELVGKLCAETPYQVQAAAFMLDGKPLAILKDQSEAQTVKDNIFAKYATDGATVESESFVENVSIADIFAEKSAIITMDKAIETLTAGTAQTSVYTVKPNDVLGQIAAKNNISLSDLLAANPALTVKSTLKIGQKLNLETVTPLLTVKTVETIVKDETVPAPVQERVNPRAAAESVLQEGKDGKQRVTERVTMLNGIVQDVTVLNTVSLQDPVTKIIEKPK